MSRLAKWLPGWRGHEAAVSAARRAPSSCGGVVSVTPPLHGAHATSDADVAAIRPARTLGEVRQPHATGFVHLAQHHITFFTMLGSPSAHAPLKSPANTGIEFGMAPPSPGWHSAMGATPRRRSCSAGTKPRSARRRCCRRLHPALGAITAGPAGHPHRGRGAGSGRGRRLIGIGGGAPFGVHRSRRDRCGNPVSHHAVTEAGPPRDDTAA